MRGAAPADQARMQPHVGADCLTAPAGRAAEPFPEKNSTAVKGCGYCRRRNLFEAQTR